MISRRKMIQGMAAAGALGFGLPSSNAFANGPKAGIKTKRVIFFLQNNGFDPNTCLPEDVKESCSLSEFKLQEHMSPLEPYKDRMHVITGLHGRHMSPDHSSYFGALGAYFGAFNTAPAAITVDHAMSRQLPKTILPHLCIGFESLSMMRARPTIATLSASGAGKPIYMHSDPNLLYQSIFGSIAGGDVKRQFNNHSNILQKIAHRESGFTQGLPEADRMHHTHYANSLLQMNDIREQLADKSDILKKYAPKLDDRYKNPEFETDWHDRLLDIGIAALQANLTNVLTIGSGRAGYIGSYEGIGVKMSGHGLGHIKQTEREEWVKIRQYNCRMLVKIMKALEAVPEGNGTMMDNTLIVYTSDCAETQHSRGGNWPFVLLGNGGGHFKTGEYTKVAGRPVNDLYTTFLRGIGVPADRFNLDANMAERRKSKIGPIEGILA